MLHTPKGFTRRVIKDEDDEPVWDIFCKAHASAVSEPLKPRAKSKVTTQVTVSFPTEMAEEKSRSSSSSSSSGSSSSSRRGNDRRESKTQYSMAHLLRKTAQPPRQNDSSKVKSDDDKKKFDDNRRKFRKGSDDGSDTDEDEDNDDDSIPKNDLSKNRQNANHNPITPSPQQYTFPLLTLNEWPGQAEGEAMDLEHFWNVAAMQYPEDHPAEVI